MLRLLGFFKQPTKVAIQTGATAVATTVIATELYQASSAIYEQIKEKYQQFQDEEQANSNYATKINY